MDKKMFSVEKNTAIPVGIDDLLASSISIVVFSVAVKFAIVAPLLCVCSNNFAYVPITFIMYCSLAGETFSLKIS